MTHEFESEVVQALAALRLRVRTGMLADSSLAEEFNTLDNAGVFARLDEQTDYASAEAILAESALKASAEDRFAFEHGLA